MFSCYFYYFQKRIYIFNYIHFKLLMLSIFMNIYVTYYKPWPIVFLKKVLIMPVIPYHWLY